MALDGILYRLQLRHPDPCRARELGQLGFMEWLNSLPSDGDFNQEAMIAYRRALPLQRTAPAIGVFCDLLVAATRLPPEPLDLSLPHPDRHGGAKARRMLR